MKTNLDSPGAGRAQQLTKLAREINDREEVITATQSQAFDRTSAWLCEIALQGQTLLKVKELLKHGDFIPWIAAHCPLVSDRQARKYMRVAANWSSGAKVEGAKNLREALQLCAGNEEGESGEARSQAKSWPPFLEAIGRFGKFATYIERNPLLNWPLEGREKLREKMEPIAMALWPDKFA